MPDLQASEVPEAWIPGIRVTCEPPEASAVAVPLASYEHTSEFHDHERYGTDISTKSFAIMERAADREAPVANGSDATSTPRRTATSTPRRTATSTPRRTATP